VDTAALNILKEKYILLITGQVARVVYDGNSGDRAEFFAADATKFLAYIRIYDPSFMADPTPVASRICPPIGFVFR